jgi:hypothetical protein
MSDNVEKLRSVLDLEDRIADIKGLGLMIFTGDPLRLFILKASYKYHQPELRRPLVQ